MAQSIEAFVQKLQAEGVQAGKDAADRLRAEAQAEGERIVADARRRAEQIVADADAQARRTAEQQQHELELAARDAVLRLREAVGTAVAQLLRHQAGEVLADRQFLAKLIHDVVTQYAHDDAHREVTVEVRVNKDTADALADWAVSYLGHAHADGKRADIDLKGTLQGVGFEYTAGESTVEVTAESVVAVLQEHMTPRLREILDRAFGDAAR